MPKGKRPTSISGMSAAKRPRTEVLTRAEAVKEREFSEARPLQVKCQEHTCKATRNKDLPRCFVCRSDKKAKAGEECRFADRRLFNDKTKEPVGIKQGKVVADALGYRDDWNVPLERSEIERTKIAAAMVLLPLLLVELEQIERVKPVHRPTELGLRTTCEPNQQPIDSCSTALFWLSWVCLHCGREMCEACYNSISAGSSDLHCMVYEQGDIHLSMLNCGGGGQHEAGNFTAITRFSADELFTATGEMAEVVQRASVVPGISVSGPQFVAPFLADGIPYWEIQRFMSAELSDQLFRATWARGEPLVISHAHDAFQIEWGPQYFRDNHGEDVCQVQDCQTQEMTETNVYAFFQRFERKAKKQEACLKLKDWPPQTEFQKEFPVLYDDFQTSAPLQGYVRQDGVHNIASHFPVKMVPPDLGPKMYIAYANRLGTGAGSEGSTRLHMDLADALNLMTFASSGSKSEPPRGAAWDIFRAEDSDKIRHFIKETRQDKRREERAAKQDSGPAQEERATIEDGGDPFHVDQMYLDDTLRQRLWEKYQVASYRVYQKPGEAVLIPAGCAHQVCNLSNCIKVAIDFVSLESIPRCETLMTQFRQRWLGQASQEDVVQLHPMLWQEKLQAGVE
ncbi:Clavaminate synthase-like protein [Mycena latifolia]|nr:Clavaminate synthase-like protein [Mycena latifolia]